MINIVLFKMYLFIFLPLFDKGKTAPRGVNTKDLGE